MAEQLAGGTLEILKGQTDTVYVGFLHMIVWQNTMQLRQRLTQTILIFYGCFHPEQLMYIAL